MKKFKIALSAAISALALSVLCSAACTGNNTANRAEPFAGGTVVSFVASESETYSSVAEVVKEVADSVVEISTESVTTQFGRQYIVSGAGSGVIVGKSDEYYFIITNNHVIEGANEITVRTRAGNEFAASLLASDDSADIAVVTVTSDEELKLAVWGDSDDLQTGESLIAIGNPLGNLGGTVTSGILSASGRTITVGNFAMNLLQTDAAINPGNSGGGLFNMRGQLIGIVNAKTSKEGIEGLCFAIPSATAKNVFEDLTECGYLKGRATLGIGLSEATVSSTGGQSTVAYIVSVDRDDGNFQKYDRLSKINGVEISSVLDYNNVMATIKPDDTVEVEVFRGTLTQSLFGNSLSFDTTPVVFSVTAKQYGIKI